MDGLLEPGNIDLHSRPSVRNPDGSISTVRSTSMNFGNGEVLIPTVSDDGRILTDDEAAQQYIVSGKHLGRFDTPDNATAYAQQLHLDQEREYVGGNMAENDPATIASKAAAMVKARGAAPTANNLNRASLAVSRNEEATDFDDMLEGAASGVARPPKPRAKSAGPGGEHTPRQPMANGTTQNKPPETPKAGDGPGPTTNASPQQNATGTRGDGTIQTPLTHDRRASRTVPLPEFDAAGNPLGTQALVTHNSPQARPAPPAATAAQSATVAPVEQYVDQIIAETPAEQPMPIPGPQSLSLAPRNGTDYTPPPGSVAPVQSNPAVAPAAVQAPMAEQPAMATEAQQPPKTFQEFLAQNGGTQGMTNDFMSSPAMGMLFPRGLNTGGAGAAGGARGAATAPRALPAPSPGLPPGSVNPPGPMALPSSYGPPMPRGNPNMAQPPPSIPLQGGPSQAMRMPPVPQSTQGNMIANTDALVRQLRARGTGSRRTGAPNLRTAAE